MIPVETLTSKPIFQLWQREAFPLLVKSSETVCRDFHHWAHLNCCHKAATASLLNCHWPQSTLWQISWLTAFCGREQIQGKSTPQIPPHPFFGWLTSFSPLTYARGVCVCVFFKTREMYVGGRGRLYALHEPRCTCSYLSKDSSYPLAVQAVLHKNSLCKCVKYKRMKYSMQNVSLYDL